MDREEQEGRFSKKKFFGRRRVCRFCSDKDFQPDFKNARILSQFVSERGRIVPRRLSGNCALHQRDLNLAIKRARVMAILPFTSTQR